MKIKYILLIALGLLLVSLLSYKFGTYSVRRELANAQPIVEPTDSVFVNGWASQKEYDHWKDATFTIPEYSSIPISFQRAIVKIFIDNKYHSTNEYFLTKIKDRSDRVIAYGVFTGNGDLEMAFLLENRDYKSSAIWIIIDKGNILYWKEMSNELPTIKQFSKGALVYMDGMQLVPSPSEGIIQQNKSSKYALIYNHKTKTFDSYYQYTAGEIRSAQQEMEEERSEEGDTADATQ